MNMRGKRGFSLIEVNMAIFVMATGVLAIAALYPMGLRESIESQADFKQVMFADYVLNIAVAAASSTNVTWAEWKNWANDYNTAGLKEDDELKVKLNNDACVPDFIKNDGRLQEAITAYNSKGTLSSDKGWGDRNKTFAIYCVLVPGFSDQIMGIMVRSLNDSQDMTSNERVRRLETKPLYYAEARFQGMN